MMRSYLINKKISPLKSNQLITLLYVITCISIYNLNVFNFISNKSLFINATIICICLFLDNKFSKKALIFILFAISFSVTTIFFTNGGFGSVITFIVPIFLHSCICQSKFNEKDRKIILFFSAIMLVYVYIYSIKYVGNFIYFSHYDINSNTIGIFSMFAFMYLNALTDMRGKKYIILLVISCLLSFMCMYNCESRMTTVALLVYILLGHIPYNRLSGQVLYFISIIVIMLGTLFPYIYLMMYRHNITFELFGKTLYTGREQIWDMMFEMLTTRSTSLLFGLGSKVELWKGHNLNVHSNYFNIIVNFGIVGYAIFYYYIIKNIKMITKSICNQRDWKLLSIFICAVLILGFTETTTLWSEIFIMAYFSLGLVYQSFDNNQGEKYHA